MRWRADGDNTIRSDSGYAILRCTSDGVPTGRFLAFLVRFDSRFVIGGYDSADDARAACNAHHSKLTEAA